MDQESSHIHTSESETNENGSEQIQSGQAVRKPPAFNVSAQTPANPIQQKSGIKLESEKEESSNSSDHLIASADPPPFQLKSNNSSGMDEDTLTHMSGSFGADFSDVNIHKDSQSAVEAGALAYTQGNDIHFAPGQYDASSKGGQELLGHELTHVVQQREGRVQANNSVNGMPLNDDKGLEKEADDWGSAVAQKKSAPGKKSTPSGTNMSDFQVIQQWKWPWESDEPDKDKKDKDTKKKIIESGKNKGTNFDTDVTLAKNGGTVQNSMRIKINFIDTDLKVLKDNILDTDKGNLKDWEKAINKLKKDAPDKLKWTDKEKAETKKKYNENVQSVWPTSQTKLFFQLDEKDYEKYKVSNDFKIDFTEKADFHHEFAVVKMDPSLGNVIRSYQGGTLGGFHDSRTFGATEKRKMSRNYIAHQVGNFDDGKTDITPGVSAEINTFVTDAKKVIKDHASDTPTPTWQIDLTGRATSKGSKSANRKIANARAAIVEKELKAKLPEVASSSIYSPDQGNAKTNNDDKYRRVEVVFKDANLRDIEQTTMAHETGHMFGYGDEYGDLQTGGGVLPKFEGDESDGTAKAIRDAGMGEDVVKDTRVEQNSESIMNTGNVVGVGHYSLFLIELKKIAVDADTKAQLNWQVIKG